MGIAAVVVVGNLAVPRLGTAADSTADSPLVSRSDRNNDRVTIALHWDIHSRLVDTMIGWDTDAVARTDIGQDRKTDNQAVVAGNSRLAAGSRCYHRAVVQRHW